MLELKNISKTYRSKNGVTHRALNDVSLSFGEKGLVFIVGRSGGGKSTLLNMIAALDRPDRGEILLYGNSFRDFNNSKLDSYRNTYIGVVFQEYNLIPTLTVYQNIALSLGLQNNESSERVDNAIKQAGLEDIKNRKPNEISGGQSQRVAIARAVVKDPKVILADEPTGNLDSKTGAEMFRIFKELSKEKLVIIVTHDRDVADELGDRVIEIKDGRVHKDLVRTTELYEPAVDTVGDRLVRVPKGKHLDELALEEINGIISKTDRDTYIINEKDIDKVKSMNIHVKNAVKLDQADNSTYYFPYRPEPEVHQDLSLIKSKMPGSVGLKLSLSMLKYKKFRLVMTIIMLILALFLSAVVGVFKFYNFDRAAAKTITKEGYEYLLAAKSGEYVQETVFSENELKALGGISSGVCAVYSENLKPEYINSSESYKKSDKYYDLFESFFGFVEIEEKPIYNTAYIAGGAPRTYSEVVISELAAKFIIDRGVYANTADYNDLLNKEIELSGVRLKICGIYETDLKSYEQTKEYIAENVNIPYDSLSQLKETLYYSQLSERDGFALVKRGYIDNVIKNLQKYPASAAKVNGAAALHLSYIAPSDKSGDVIYETGKDGYIIDEALFTATFGESTGGTEDMADALKKFNEADNDYLIKQVNNNMTESGTHTSLILNEMKIAAVVKGTDGTLYVNRDDFTSFVSDDITVRKVLVKTENSVSGNKSLLSRLGSLNVYPEMRFYSDYKSYSSNLNVLSTILTRTLIMISIAAALLLFSFISSSVRLEGRHIGILRGMGARGIDTFKAFGIEGVLITTAALIFTLVLIAVLFPLINMGMSAGYLYHFYSVVINPFAVILIIITAAIITAAAITIPLIRLTKMMPVTAMNSNGNQR
ncbi:MAG: ABC transporter ATP-binding protein/permease [Clostridia bacterium]|nr:ABC transporter ATP-binding protein/permease [Clostridia bacterium]